MNQSKRVFSTLDPCILQCHRIGLGWIGIEDLFLVHGEVGWYFVELSTVFKNDKTFLFGHLTLDICKHVFMMMPNCKDFDVINSLSFWFSWLTLGGEEREDRGDHC